VNDLIINLVFILIAISPFVFYRLGKKRTSYVNLAFVALYFSSWVYIIFTGTAISLNISTIVWLTSLTITLVFLIISGVQLFYRFFPGFNKVALVTIAFIIVGISSLIFLNFYKASINSILNIAMVYTIPLFFLSLFVIVVIRINKQARVTR
jgi:hypothetical protein